MGKSCYNCKHFTRYYIWLRGRFRITYKGYCEKKQRKIELCEKWEEKPDDSAEMQEDLDRKISSLRRKLTELLDVLQVDKNPIEQEEDGKNRPKARKGAVTRSAKPEKEEENRPAGEGEDIRSTAGEGGSENSGLTN